MYDFQIFASNKIRFMKILKIHEIFFYKFLFVFVSQCIQREYAHNLNKIRVQSALKA